MHQFLSTSDIPSLNKLREEAYRLKKNPFLHALAGKYRTLGLVSLREDFHTQHSIQKAAFNLGMNVMFINLKIKGLQVEVQSSKGSIFPPSENIREVAESLGEYCDILALYDPAGLVKKEEDYSQEILHYFSEYSRVPLLNLESALSHPLQALANWLTIEEFKRKARPRVVVQWVPYDRAISPSVANASVALLRKAGMEVLIGHPPNYRLSDPYLTGLKSIYHPEKALTGADFVLALNWASIKNYGQIDQKKLRWKLSAQKLSKADNPFLLFPQPVLQGLGIEADLLRNPKSLIRSQAANRVRAAQLILKELLLEARS